MLRSTSGLSRQFFKLVFRGSNPLRSTLSVLVQLVRILLCHSRSRRFEPDIHCQITFIIKKSVIFQTEYGVMVAQQILVLFVVVRIRLGQLY